MYGYKKKKFFFAKTMIYHGKEGFKFVKSTRLRFLPRSFCRMHAKQRQCSASCKHMHANNNNYVHVCRMHAVCCSSACIRHERCLLQLRMHSAKWRNARKFHSPNTYYSLRWSRWTQWQVGLPGPCGVLSGGVLPYPNDASKHNEKFSKKCKTEGNTGKKCQNWTLRTHSPAEITFGILYNIFFSNKKSFDRKALNLGNCYFWGLKYMFCTFSTFRPHPFWHFGVEECPFTCNFCGQLAVGGRPRIVAPIVAPPLLPGGALLPANGGGGINIPPGLQVDGGGGGAGGLNAGGGGAVRKSEK